MAEKGYMTKVIGREWIETVFDAQTKEMARGRWRLLIVDGHVSHFSWSTRERTKLPCSASRHTPLIYFKVSKLEMGLLDDL